MPAGARPGKNRNSSPRREGFDPMMPLGVIIAANNQIAREVAMEGLVR
jgi:hypothetical protein